MTSSVKQTLPQILMPKPGVEGKTVRGRAPQGDFAEALGLGSKAAPAAGGQVKADRGEPDIRTAVWPRLPSRLDVAAESARPAARQADTPDPLFEADREDQSSRRPAAVDDATVVADNAIDAHAAGVVPSSVRATEPVHPAAPEVGQAPAEKAAVVIAKRADNPTPQPISGRDEPARMGGEGATHASPRATEPDVATPAPSFTAAVSRIEPPESARFEPGLEPTAAAEKPLPERSTEAPREMPAEPVRPAPRVTLLAQQNIPAPMSSTAVMLVDSIATSDLLGAPVARPTLDAIHASVTHGSAQTLKLQLHPAELGMVTATLRFAGEQLSIELQVENQEAHRRLAADSETIVRALRDLGYAVDSVTVLQPSATATPAGRADMAASMNAPQGRPADAFTFGSGSGGGAGSSGGRSPEDGGNAGQGGANASQGSNGSGSGLYI